MGASTLWSLQGWRCGGGQLRNCCLCPSAPGSLAKGLNHSRVREDPFKAAVPLGPCSGSTRPGLGTLAMPNLLGLSSWVGSTSVQPMRSTVSKRVPISILNRVFQGRPWGQSQPRAVGVVTRPLVGVDSMEKGKLGTFKPVLPQNTWAWSREVGGGFGVVGQDQLHRLA